MRLHVGTSNPGKLREFEQVLAPLGITVVGAPADFAALQVQEDGLTFAANAQIKLAALSSLTEGPAVTDDSGLQVAALNQAPGVHSARYAHATAGQSQDAANRHKLLQALRDVPMAKRQAQFVAVLALRLPGEPVQCFTGTCRGHISLREVGTGGFGYDAVFIPDGATQTFAEIPAATKHAISHRGQALTAMVAYLRAHADLPRL